MHVKFDWRDVRVAEGARLESVCIRNGTVGSNPTLSANGFRGVSRSFKFSFFGHFCFVLFRCVSGFFYICFTCVSPDSENVSPECLNHSQ